jgi:hypothetical protein
VAGGDGFQGCFEIGVGLYVVELDLGFDFVELRNLAQPFGGDWRAVLVVDLLQLAAGVGPAVSKYDSATLPGGFLRSKPFPSSSIKSPPKSLEARFSHQIKTRYHGAYAPLTMIPDSVQQR